MPIFNACCWTFLVSSFNGGIDQGLDRLRAGKPINIVGMLSVCFKFCDFLNGLIKLIFYWVTF